LSGSGIGVVFSSLTDAIGMFDDSKMSIANMDNTLRGWAKLDTATGETAIQNNVTWDIKNYTAFIPMLPTVKSLIMSLPAFLKP
jgi:hypothetical protein